MRKRLLLLFIFILILSIGLFIIEWSTPPLQLLENARESVLNAKRVNAHKLSPELFNKSQLSYDSAMLLWNLENKKISVLRNYERMELLLQKSMVLARDASTSAINREQKYWEYNATKYRMVRDLFDQYNTTFSSIPLNEEKKNKLSELKLVLDEIELKIKNKSPRKFDTQLDQCEKFIKELTETSSSTLKTYFQDFAHWEWLQAVGLKNSSRIKQHVLIVDKLSRECKVYYNGKHLNTFSIELGINWIGDKQRSGDKTTPEGNYTVIKKKEKSDTKYYKALLLNYPNDEDKKNHKLNIQNGSIPKNSSIGGDIEIHGMGGKGVDWTDGCIALSNSDMDKLYSLIPTKTPVIIVGSTKPLEDVLNQ